MRNLEYDDIICGIWKFRETVPVEELLKLAEEWRTGPGGKSYLSLYVRRCSKNQFGIGFMYQINLEEDELETTRHKFFEKVTDMLKRRYGNNFVGYDISWSVWILTQLEINWR
ncbi:hypothetical protein A2115_02650 [Candidatus Woesebacteria bacterium GWA1_41_8]|uniref:Uncharacterized protein n=1 Tax=Candidatus Woesebacteria bacterium GWA1_41_8 TaxID=1802471 RepID=A0A1F7WK60_9BACT|nr:MAG: hypothetical protein A2115_02650 [Candidatus Woesebacteria bacterium GWA1_41_8]